MFRSVWRGGLRVSFPCILQSTQCYATLPKSSFPILTSIPAYRAWRQKAFDDKKTVGYVPTMGVLHDGHLSLVRRSLHENDLTVVSIYVNPIPSGSHKDYPRTLLQDLEKLSRQHVDVSGEVRTTSALFFPGVEDMHPFGIPQDGTGTFVEVNGHSHQMEGASRPGYCRRVATLATKLFNVVQPTNTYFGQKDIQQALVLHRMCRDLLLAYPEAEHFHIVPTARDPIDGLALSSRNMYLSAEERSVANTLYRALQAAESNWLSGGTKDACIHRAKALVKNVATEAASRGIEMKLDYIEMNDADSLEILDGQSQRQSDGNGTVILSGEVYVGDD